MRTVLLRCEPWEAEIVPDYAMNVIRLTYRGDPVLHSPDRLEQLEQFPFLYGTPLLFPPDVMRENTFSFEGKSYTISYASRKYPLPPIHGRLYDATMTLLRSSAQETEGVFQCEADRYPFPFRLTIACKLSTDDLRQCYTVENTGSEPMPLVLGLHTSFAAKDSFSVSVGQAWRFSPDDNMPSKLISLSREQMRLRQSAEAQGRKLHGFFSDSGEGLARSGPYLYRVSANFHQWVIWNKSGNDGFICLEPLSGAVNGLNMPGEAIRLEPGQMERFSTHIGLYRADSE